MKLLSTLTLASALLLPHTLMAKEVSGVQVADTVTLDSQALQLTGAGVRSKFFMDLYVGSLYLPAALSSTAAVIDAPIAAIRLNITSGMITSEKCAMRSLKVLSTRPQKTPPIFNRKSMPLWRCLTKKLKKVTNLP